MFYRILHLFSPVDRLKYFVFWIIRTFKRLSPECVYFTRWFVNGSLLAELCPNWRFYIHSFPTVSMKWLKFSCNSVIRFISSSDTFLHYLLEFHSPVHQGSLFLLYNLNFLSSEFAGFLNRLQTFLFHRRTEDRITHFILFILNSSLKSYFQF